MIHVTNDWILKPLPNADVQPLTNYVNAISCECFEPLVNLNNALTQKYITSSTGVKLPVYQPAPDDVAYYTTIPSGDWNRYKSALDLTYDVYGKGNTTTSPAGQRIYIDSKNYRIIQTIGIKPYSSSTAVPLGLKFFNPDTKRYDEILYFRKMTDRQVYAHPGDTTKRPIPNVLSYLWEKENNTDMTKRTFLFQSPHYNLEEGDNYDQSGTILPEQYNGKIYMYADLGFDIINEKWVGLLNLYVIGFTTYYRHWTETTETYTNQREDNVFSGHRYAVSPYANIASTSVTDVVGTNSNLTNFYSRAFELEDGFEPDIQNITLPMTKIGCYGPNTRISP